MNYHTNSSMLPDRTHDDLVSDQMLSPADFSRMLQIGRRTFQTWRAAGKLPKPDLAIGKVIRWRRSTVEKWINRQARDTR